MHFYSQFVVCLRNVQFIPHHSYFHNIQNKICFSICISMKNVSSFEYLWFYFNLKMLLCTQTFGNESEVYWIAVELQHCFDINFWLKTVCASKMVASAPKVGIFNNFSNSVLRVYCDPYFPSLVMTSNGIFWKPWTKRWKLINSYFWWI